MCGGCVLYAGLLDFDEFKEQRHKSRIISDYSIVQLEPITSFTSVSRKSISVTVNTPATVSTVMLMVMDIRIRLMDY